MRILVLTQYFFPHTGGSQEYILELYKNLIALDPSVSVDVLCYNTDGAPDREIIDGVNIYRVPCIEVLSGQFALPNPFKLIQTVLNLKRQHCKYDVVNSHTRFFDNSWYAPIVAKYLGAKSLLTDHCASHPVHHNPILQFVIKIFDSLLVKIVPQLYDQVTAVSHATAKFLKDHGYSGRIPIFYSGVNQAFLKKIKLKAPISPKKDQIVVSFVGRMITSKNPALAVEVAKVVTQKNSNVVFAFAGDGPELEKLQSNKSNQIIFLGKLNRPETSALLRSTDMLIHPSVHHEGLPITLLEAGASEVAVIASNAGATCEVIQDNITGLIVEPSVNAISRAVEKLIDQPNLRKNLARNLKTTVTRDFSWNKTATKFQSFLNSILQ